MEKMKTSYFCYGWTLVLLLSVLACNRHKRTETQDAEWNVLFNGKELEKHWQGPNGELPGAGWKVDDSVLVLLPGGKGNDLISREQFSDFELELEYKLADSGNTGIKYFVRPYTDKTGNTVLNGPEFQLIDDYRHDAVIDNKSPETATGALYLLYAPTGKRLNGPGKWNHVRIIAKGANVAHWLNGDEILTYERGTEDFRKRVSKTKFQEYEQYGEAEEGHILLQDHQDGAFFKNIRIKRLTKD